MVLAIDPVDISQYGYPLFAVYGPVDFEFKRSIELENNIWKIDSTQMDYTDGIRATSVGIWDGYFLTYKDDFKWQNDIPNSINFPSRSMYLNGEIISDFSLDLFGIPCD